MTDDVQPSPNPTSYDVPSAIGADPVDVLAAVRDGLAALTPSSTAGQVRTVLLAVHSALDAALTTET